MKLVSVASSLLVVLAAAPAAAQDPVKAASEHYKLVAENERVRVLHATLPAGSTAAMHSHPEHVAVSLTSGAVQSKGADGKVQDIPLKEGEPMLLPAGAHATANTGKAPMEVILVELKGKGSPGAGAPPESRPGMKRTSILKGDRVDVYRVTMDASFHEPAGSKHDFDQVVIPLGPGDTALTMDGKTKSTWKKGDAALIGRGVPHESKAGTTSGDMIIVVVK